MLWIFHHDLLDSGWAPGRREAALAGAETVVFQGTNANATSARAHLVLPSAAYVEREGTFTNFEGRVQRFRTAVAPLGEALAGLGHRRPDGAGPRRDRSRAHCRAGGARVRRRWPVGARLRGR